MTQRRLMAEGASNPNFTSLGSITKLLSTRATKLARNVGMSLLQAEGMLWANDRSLAGVMQEHFLFSPASTIYGGTDQIQLNIIAERVLGLPAIDYEEKTNALYHRGVMMRNDPCQSEVEGLTAFLRAEVFPRQHALRDAGVAMYDDQGHLSPEVLVAFSGVRRASASAGFYTMLLAEELGGGGLGFEALFRLWETLFDVCGAEYWLGHQAISHWSRGPAIFTS